MEKFLGKEYVLVSSENFDDFLAFTGISYLNRKIALNLKQIHCLTRDQNGVFIFSFKSKLMCFDTSFTPGEEFEEIKPDGVTVRSLITFEGNKMTHIQIEPSGRTTKHVREFFHDKLIIPEESIAKKCPSLIDRVVDAAGVWRRPHFTQEVMIGQALHAHCHV